MSQTELELEWIELAGRTGMLRRFKLPSNSAAPPQAEPQPQTEAPTLKILSTLTPDQELQIPYYREKWRDLVLHTEPLDRDRIQKNLQVAYHLLGLPQPSIQFFASPHAALPAIAPHLEHVIIQKWFHNRVVSRFDLGERLVSQLQWWLDHDLQQQVWQNFGIERSQQIWYPIWQPLEEQLWQRLEPQVIQEGSFHVSSQQQALEDWIESCCPLPETWTATAGFLDFCISELNCSPNPDLWQVFRELVQSCTWMFPFRDTCIVCNRPTEIHLNDHYQLHAIGKPAVQFADGQAVDICYGQPVQLPAQYRSVPPEQWQISWLDQESDPVLRQVLIAGICEAHGIDFNPDIQTATDLQRWIYKITPLTSLAWEQAAQIPAFQEKWEAIAFATTSIDRPQATTAIQQLYTHLELAAPEIHFFASPAAALQFLWQTARQNAEQNLQVTAKRPRSHLLIRQIWKQVAADWQQILRSQWLQNVKATLQSSLGRDLNFDLDLDSYLRPEQLTEPCFASPELKSLAPVAVLRTFVDLTIEYLQSDRFRSLGAAERRKFRGILSQPDRMPTEAPLLKGLVQARQQRLLWDTIDETWGADLSLIWERNVQNPLRHQFQAYVDLEIQNQNALMQQFQRQIRHLNRLLRQVLQPELGDRVPINAGLELYDACWLDFGFSGLNFPGDREQWQVFQNLVSACGWVYAFEKVCLVCDRPTQLRFNNQEQLHAVGQPAVQFADGFSLYVYQGVLSPP